MGPGGLHELLGFGDGISSGEPAVSVMGDIVTAIEADAGEAAIPVL